MVQAEIPQTASQPGAPQHLPPVEWDGILARLRGSTVARRFVPYGVSVLLIRFATWVKLRMRPGRLDKARETMDAVVGRTPLESRLDELAARHVAAMAESIEFSWRPWLVAGVPVDGAENFRRAAPGQGTLVSITHYGPLLGRRNIGRYVEDLDNYWSAAGDWRFSDLPKGYRGYWFRHSMRTDSLSPKTLLAGGSRAALESALRGGGTIMLAMDLPGSQETRFLGKPVHMAGGTARLAASTGSLVVPVTLVPAPRSRWRMTVGKPLDPADFATWQDLHQALADWHAEQILAAPEYYEDPVRGGAWAVATRDGWPNIRR